MADANLVVRVRDVGTRNLTEIRRKLDRITVSATAAGAAMKAFSKSYNDAWVKRLDDINKRFTRHFDEIDAAVKLLGNVLLKGLGLALKATAAEFALMGASMIAVHGLFAAGNLLARAYSATMNVVAAGAASAAVAIASVAAAMRENNAAMFAYKAKGYSQFGSNLNRVRVVMRGLESDSQLATVGVENLNAAYAAVSKRSTFTRGSQNLLRGLMDFASAGQPLDQGVKAAGELIGTLQDPKASFGEISKAAEALGPAMKDALDKAKKEGVTSAAALKQAILSGNLATLGGVEGQFDAVNGTLMSVLKNGFNQIRTMFADMGQPFLEPLKRAADEILVVIRRTFVRTAADLNKFGKGDFVDSLVGMAEKLERLFVHLVRNYLPAANGMMERMGDRWERFTDGWNRIADGLRPLIKGAQVLEDVLGKIFGPIWDKMKEKFGTFNAQLIDNKAELEAFGTALGNMFVKFGDIVEVIRDLYFKALPFMTKMVDGLTKVASGLERVLSMMNSMFGGAGDGFGAMGVLMGIGIVGRQMKNTKGGFLPSNIGSMNVQAGQVYVTGATAGGQMDPRAAAAQNKFGTPYPMGTGAVHGTSGDGMRSYRAARSQALNSGMPLTPQQGAAFGLSAQQTARINKTVRARATASMKKNLAFGKYRGVAGPLQQFSANNIRLRRASSEPWNAAMRMNNTGTAKMGTMAALGMLSSVMPEETQGAMALGSMVGAFNPLAGLAVAGLGTALTSENAGLGILGGLGGGATAGFMVAGPAGAAVGAILGAAVGGIKAEINKNEARREAAREVASNAASEILESMTQGIMDAAEAGRTTALTSGNIRSTMGFGRLDRFFQMARSYQKDAGNRTHEERQSLVRQIYSNRAALGFEMSFEDFQKAFDKPHEFLEKFEELLGPKMAAQVLVLDKYDNRMEAFTQTMGMSEEALLELAAAGGVNLYDAAMKTKDMFIELSKAMIDSSDELSNVFSDVFGGMVDDLQTIKEREQAPLIVNEAAQNLMDASREGTLTRTDVADQLIGMIGGYQSAFGDDTVAAAQFLADFGTGRAFEQDALLGGMSAENQAIVRGVIQEILPNLRSQLTGGALSELLTGAFGALGQEVTFDANTLNQLVSDPRRLQQFTSQFTRENLAEIADMKEAGPSALFDLINTTFPDLNLSMKDFQESAATQALNLENAGAELQLNVEEFVTTLGNALDELKEALSIGDTRSPRGIGDTRSSRFANTLSAHSGLDSMATGKRFITSGWRNFALGSPSSDHIMGRAYDLQGQNLGAYKSLVDKSGGFAEFHGAGGGRHLHVVPNVSGGAMGDSSTPLSMGSSGGGVGTTNYNNYTINVNGAEASPQEIAETVMAEIKRSEMSMRERY